MKLRMILFVLSMLAFLSASTGGYFYYSSLKEAAFREAERQAGARLQTINKNFSAFLSENIKPVRSLTGMDELQQSLIWTNDAAVLDKANMVLDMASRLPELKI